MMPTKRQAELLRIMAGGPELVVSGGEVWVDLERTSLRTFYTMLRAMWIKHPGFEPIDPSFERFEITPRGRDALDLFDEC